MVGKSISEMERKMKEDEKELDLMKANAIRLQHLNKSEMEPLEATYNVDKLFPIAAHTALVIYCALLALVWYIVPSEEWEYLTIREQNAATIPFCTASLSLILVLSTHVLHGDEKRTSGIVYAACIVTGVSAVTNCLLAFFPTAVMLDQHTQSRVFLIRWCEFIPLSGCMTFLCDIIDVPKSRKSLRTAILFSLSQTASCIPGLIFPFCKTFISWFLWMFISCLAWLAIFPRLWQKRRTFLATPRGTTFMEKERYRRHLHAYELMRLCASLWSGLVIAYFVNMYVHLALPVGHPLRIESLAMYVDSGFDAFAKTAYMRQILDAHNEVFHSEGLARKQLVELRKLMSVLWTSSSDLIILTVKHEKKRLSLVSSALDLLLQGSSGAENSSCDDDDDDDDKKKNSSNSNNNNNNSNPTRAGQDQMALVVETVPAKNGNDVVQQKNGDEHDRVCNAYHIDSSVFALDELHEASIAAKVPFNSKEVTVTAQIVAAAAYQLEITEDKNEKLSASRFAPFAFQRSDGTECRCEMKVLPHDENGMVIIVHDVTEKFKRFQAERKAEEEARRRQREAQSQSRFVRHEVKNGLLAGIELIDSLRSALDEIDKPAGSRMLTRSDSQKSDDTTLTNQSGTRLGECVKRITELDSTLHDVLDTVLAEAMARDVIHEVYHPRMERIDVQALLRAVSTDADRFPVSRKSEKAMPFLRLDPQLIRYIHRNALSNACKYGLIGGQVKTIVDFDDKENFFEMHVVNLPGSDHDRLIALGDKGSNLVFEQGERLHMNFPVKDRFVSSGDGAWIAHKCAKALGGGCSIRFEANETIFTFRCPSEPLQRTEKVKTVDFEVPPGTHGIAIDDSKMQRKLLSRILGHIGIEEGKRIVIGECSDDLFNFEGIIRRILAEEEGSRILLIIDENLDYSGNDGNGVIMSGSVVMKEILDKLSPIEESRLFALVRSANDSATDVAKYMARTHGFFPKATMNKERVREILAPLWIERYPE